MLLNFSFYLKKRSYSLCSIVSLLSCFHISAFPTDSISLNNQQKNKEFEVEYIEIFKDSVFERNVGLEIIYTGQQTLLNKIEREEILYIAPNTVVEGKIYLYTKEKKKLSIVSKQKEKVENNLLIIEKTDPKKEGKIDYVENKSFVYPLEEDGFKRSTSKNIITISFNNLLKIICCLIVFGLLFFMIIYSPSLTYTRSYYPHNNKIFAVSFQRPPPCFFINNY